MSKREVERLIGKALMDAGFRRRLLADPLAALEQEGFELDEGEIKSLAQVPADSLQALAEGLQQGLWRTGWSADDAPEGNNP